MCKASASVLVVAILLALLCTTVMHMCQITLLLLQLPILNARLFTAATLKTVICFVLCAVCVGDSPSSRCMGMLHFLYLIVIHRYKSGGPSMDIPTDRNSEIIFQLFGIDNIVCLVFLK